MFLYLIKSSICLFLLLGFYLLVLEREKMHRFNRFYLLGSLVFSLLIPFYIITISVPVVAESMNFVPQSEFATINPELLSIPVEITKKPFNYTPYLIALYALISLILSFRFGKNLLQLWRKIAKNQHVHYLMATVVLLKEKVLPHTFWNYIFIDKKEYASKQLDAQILTHELAHVEQKHTLDVLFIEVLQLIFWFNPIFSWYKKVIQLNHEFLADDAVIGAHKNLTAYQHVLLNLSSQQQTTYLTSNLNYSLTKKRIIMMTTPSSRSKILLKKLAIVPLLAGFTFLFAHKVEAHETNHQPDINKTLNNKYNNNLVVVNINESKTAYNGVNYSYTIKNNGNKTIDANDYSIVFKVNNELVKFRKQLPKINPGEIFKNVSNYTFYSNQIRNKSKHNFIDIKPRNTLDYSLEIKYKNSNGSNNIIKGTSLFDKKSSQSIKTTYVGKGKQQKGLSKEEMAEYKRLFNSGQRPKIYKYKDIIRMMALYKSMSKQQQKSVVNIRKVVPLLPQNPNNKKVPTTAQLNSWKNNDKFALWIDGKVVNNKVLDNYKNTDFYYYFGSFVYKNARSERFPQEYQFNLYTKSFYTKMLAKQKKERLANILVIYMNKTGKLLVNNDVTATQNLRNTIEKFIKEGKPFTVALIADKKTKREDIKKLTQILKKNGVRRYSIHTRGFSVPPPPPPRKAKTQEKVSFHKNWYITIDGQKYYYTFDKNERIARYYKNGKFANLDIKKEYIKKNTLFEKLKNTGVHYVFKPKAEKATIEHLYSDLGGMYFRMSRANKNKVPFPKNPNGVYLQILRKDGSTYYKKRTELTAADKKLLPPPPPRPNATKDEIERYKIANANWKKSLKNIPTPPTPLAPPKPKKAYSN